ncbi:hypothetical protein [Prauserella muralis]|uniref:Uncharacterized protein n=1 Tax=Prauserella muralis TaxID=588067 RepID=A0A2V4ATX8_9PSEU|nr:hypothetical protein [Prauserella muralis]PXY19007.1 hypothetical protein BAY60_29760 [Prauserella muralis]TWE28899.1 hypothetical protein FHX69_1567 [Prauserella muralis]
MGGSDLPNLDRNAYLACQARELAISTERSDPEHAVQVLRHVFAEAGTAAGLWMANWYFETLRSGTTDPAINAIVDECIQELENAYGLW